MSKPYDFNRTLVAYIVVMLAATVVLRLIVLHVRHH
jgi:hypothetical protein